MTISDAAAPPNVAKRVPPTFSKRNYQLNYLHCFIIAVPPLIVLAGILAGVPLDRRTFGIAVLWYFINGFGITVGYHRFFSHRSFAAHWALQAIFAFAGAGAVQGSAKWWGRNHRIHHRYIDTDKDPYNATRGFFFTHVGWMLMKTDYSILGRVDISDLNRSPIVRFQHDYYFPIAMLSGIVLPTLICGLGWGDWMGGYIYAALAKMIFVHHSTFFVNSLAHSPIFGGCQLFSRNHTSQDSWVCALLTLGEGYHNFHHEFAHDYRNAIRWYQWDPSKWLIRSFEMMGLAWDLIRAPNAVIQRNKLSVSHIDYTERLRAIDAALAAMDNKTKPTESWKWDDVHRLVSQGRKLIVIGSYVLDMQKVVPVGNNRTSVWYDQHPGGKQFLDMFVGKDATEVFTGGVYRHSDGATNLITHLRVATLVS